jgi:type II secretory pathway component PulK
MIRSRSTGRSEGVALIAVLWLLAVLTLLAATVATLSMSSRREATDNIQIERLDLLADGAIRLTLLKIICTVCSRRGTAAGSRGRKPETKSSRLLYSVYPRGYTSRACCIAAGQSRFGVG